MTKVDNRTALVVGGNGGIGGETASALLAAGWTVKALVRDAQASAARWDRATPQPVWVAGDALDAEAVRRAAEGAAVIVHAVNPPGYRNWAQLVLPMLDSTIAAARESGARIVLPGTVYNFGPEVFAEPREDAPQNPETRKGKIRAEMERRLRAAAQDGVRTLILRAGDFFGPRSGNNWFAQIVKPGQRPKAIVNPGRPGVGHQWAYLPDAAATIVALLEREERLKPFEVVHMEGHWDPDGTAFAGAISRACGDPKLPVRRFPWWLAVLASPFVTVFREVLEMRYLWEVPLHMRNDRLVALLGRAPHTPLDEAVGTTLRGLKCLP